MSDTWHSSKGQSWNRHPDLLAAGLGYFLQDHQFLEVWIWLGDFLINWSITYGMTYCIYMTYFAPSERQTDEKSIVCVQLGLRLSQEESLGHVYVFAHHLMSLSTLSRTFFFFFSRFNYKNNESWLKIIWNIFFKVKVKINHLPWILHVHHY